MQFIIGFHFLIIVFLPRVCQQIAKTKIFYSSGGGAEQYQCLLMFNKIILKVRNVWWVCINANLWPKKMFIFTYDSLFWIYSHKVILIFMESFKNSNISKIPWLNFPRKVSDRLLEIFCPCKPGPTYTEDGSGENLCCGTKISMFRGTLKEKKQQNHLKQHKNKLWLLRAYQWCWKEAGISEMIHTVFM